MDADQVTASADGLTSGLATSNALDRMPCFRGLIGTGDREETSGWDGLAGLSMRAHACSRCTTVDLTYWKTVPALVISVE